MALQKTPPLFLNFPYVCPEPVLLNRLCLVKNAARKRENVFRRTGTAVCVRGHTADSGALVHHFAVRGPSLCHLDQVRNRDIERCGVMRCEQTGPFLVKFFPFACSEPVFGNVIDIYDLGRY